MTVIDDIWRAGFEVEVILGDLDEARFMPYLDEAMDEASPGYCQAVAKKLSALTGYMWRAPRGSPSRPGFYVIPEYDLDPINFPRDAVAGVELLTPPLPLSQAEAARQRIIDAIDDMDDYGWNFSRTDVADLSGWHVNIDGGKKHRLDVEKFALGVDELSILNQNGRLNSPYAEPQRHAYGVPLLRHLQADPSASLLKSAGLGDVLRRTIGGGKRYAANFSKLEKGYIELRHFSAASFFNGPELATQIQPIVAAFEMGHKSHHALETRLIDRFKVLRTWLDDLKPTLRTEMGEVGKMMRITSGLVFHGRQKLAKLVTNGLVELSVNGKRRGGRIIVMNDVLFPDIYEAIAVAALDIAELRAAGYGVPQLQSSKFSGAIDQLLLALQEKNLMAQVPILPHPPFPHLKDEELDASA